MTADTFSNPEIREDTLPDVATLTYEPLAPSYPRTIIIEWIFYWLVAGAITTIINIVANNNLMELLRNYVIGPYVVMTLSVLIWAPAIARAKGFAIRDRDLHFKSGIIWQKTVSLPYNRIQHIEIESGPLERFFKLTTLKFFTAGGGSADMKIPGLQFDRASKLRSYVLEQAGVSDQTDKDQQYGG